MKLDLNKEKLAELLQKGRETAVLAGAAALSGAEMARNKAEDALLCARLSSEVKRLQEEVELQLMHVGQLIYATHKGTPSGSESIQTVLEYVDSLYEQMEAHEAEIDRLKGRSQTNR